MPYDFDYAGLVDTPYALPPEGVSVPNVRVRRYRGFCQHNEQAQAFAASLVARRAELLGIVDRTPQLSDAFREKAASYLGVFFDEISSPAGSCRDVENMFGLTGGLACILPCLLGAANVTAR